MEVQALSPWLLLAIVGSYFLVLILVGFWTAGKGDNETFFKAGGTSPWYLVAWGMIGASLSGVTFVSIPGAVGLGGHNQQLSYMQVVLGYLLGYTIIALVLLPLYYRLRLTSIYGYLAERFGESSYYTGAAFFQLSRVIGSSFRLYLVAIVLDSFVLGPIGVPFWVTVAVTLALIYLYTFKGGIQTVVYTDTIQTLAMLLAVGIAVYTLAGAMGDGLDQLGDTISNSGLNQVFFFDGGWTDPNNFWKQFFSGALITIVMTGLDQDMMQKNLTCRSLPEAQKNMFSFALLLVPINLLFLILGILLFQYLEQMGIQPPFNADGNIQGDKVFPMIALEYLGPIGAITFIIGLVAAAYSSADSALTALTTSFCVDFLGFEREAVANRTSLVETEDHLSARQRRLRSMVHVGFAIVLFCTIILFWYLPDQSIINKLFTWAGFTYGPLLGLFAFGMLTTWQVKDRFVPVICILAPVLTYVINANSASWFDGLELGFLVLAVNGLLTFLGLLLLRKKGGLAGAPKPKII